MKSFTFYQMIFYNTKFLLLISNIMIAGFSFAQVTSYKDSILTYQQNYIANHEVVTSTDKKYIHFYPPDAYYKVMAEFQRKVDDIGFEMNTSSGKKQHYYLYGILSFSIHDTVQTLRVFQSAQLRLKKEYADYLFVPFTDATSGYTTYGGGRYLDFRTSNLNNNLLEIDFNKAYNPYCAYKAGFNCPIPPPENFLKIALPVGEKNFDKPYH